MLVPVKKILVLHPLSLGVAAQGEKTFSNVLAFVCGSQIEDHFICAKDAFEVDLRVPQLIILHLLNYPLCSNFLGAETHRGWLVNLGSVDRAPYFRLRNEGQPRGACVQANTVDATIRLLV